MKKVMKSCKYLIVGFVAGTSIISTPISLQAAVSQQPLSLTEGVAPNLLVTLDDSGSMAWAYAPDGISGNSGRRAGRSNTYNSMYYDPAFSYQIPKQVSLVSGEVVVTDYPTPSFTNAPNDGFNSGSTKVNLSTDYRAQWDGFLTSCPSGVTCSSGRAAAHYFRYNPSASCPTSPASSSDACYSYVKIDGIANGIDQKSNFAVWYSFYRNRNLATRSAANLAFNTLPENVRLTWGALNTCSMGAGTSSGTCNTNTIKSFADAHRVNFFKWLTVLPNSGGTPLHNAMTRAGEFLKSNTKAYKDDDGSEFSCRASYHILMTDGIWNGRPAGGTNSDGSLAYPYKDDQTNALADLAYSYWSTDLRTGLPDRIKPFIPFKSGTESIDNLDPRNNPATWQHMVNFTLALGLTNGLTLSTAPTWGGSTFTNYNELMSMGSNGLRWPTVGNDNGNNIYDLWHAAINSRGDFFSADSPDALAAAFTNILSRIADRTTSAASPAINSGLQDDGTGELISYAYQTSYSSSENWAGDIKGYKKTKTFNAVTGKYETTATEEWSARQKLALQSWSTRNIQIASSTGTSKLKPLTWANAGDATTTGSLAYWLRQNPDNVDTLEPSASTNAQGRLDFLRGDRSQEITKFRERTTILGDMISSKPVTVRGARYLTNYANDIERNTDYSDFVLTQNSRQPRVYVGANDGMLHAFDAVTGDETFAFVPTSVFPKLHKLTGKSYEGALHQFYVDGSPTVGDVYINGEWRTILVGALRAGGKGLFALDVTEPNAIKLLWEFDDSRIPAPNTVRLGYSFAQPTIARLHNGKWAIVTGNGYESTNANNGKAALLIIDAETGNLIKSLEAEGTNGVVNGLSTPRLADMNVDGVADYAYAGDLQGNIWRFNLAPTDGSETEPFKRKDSETNAAEASFKVSYNGKPLFSATSGSGVRQPITAPPTIVRHPTRYGYLIIFGTGKYFEEGDKNGIAGVKQSFYAIWDTKTLSNKSTDTLQPTSLTRSKLQVQTIEATLESEEKDRDARLVSQNVVKWAIPPSNPSDSWTDTPDYKYGWYLDLALDGEVMITDINALGQTLFFQTLVPNADPCSSGAETWTYALNPYTGGRTLHHAFVDYRSSNGDTVISAIRQPGEGGLSISQKPDGGYEACTGLQCEEVSPDPNSIGRQSWRRVEEQ